MITVRTQGFAIPCSVWLLLAAMLSLHALSGCSASPSTTPDAISETEDTPQPDVGLPEDTPIGDSADGVSEEPISILSIAPQVGSSAGGTIVTVIGHGFTQDAQIAFGDEEGLLTYVESDEKIVVQTPSHPVGKVDVTLKLEDGTQIIAPNGFTYVTKASIETIYPTEGPVSGGTLVEISGEGFSSDSILLFDGKQAISTQVIDSGQIIGLTPAGSPGKVTVQVTADGGFTTLDQGFTYITPPKITHLSPWSGPISGGTELTLNGIGLSEDAVVLLGGETVPELAPGNGTSLTVVTPPGPAGPADIQVVTPAGATLLEGGFTYLGSELDFALLNAVPNHGPQGGGNTVYLTFGGLDEGVVEVTFGGKEADVLELNIPEHLLVVLAPPADTPGEVDIQLNDGTNTTLLSGGYRYDPELTITDITPDIGPMEGGTPVVIEGAGFLTSPLSVHIGPLPATEVVVIDDQHLEAETPPGSMGFATLRITTEMGEAILQDGFMFAPPDGVKLLALTPHKGAMAGGTYIEIYGYGFDSSAQVFFGESEATDVTVHSPTFLTAYSPPWFPDTVDLKVISGGEEDVLHAAYSYFNPTNTLGGTWGKPIDGSVNVSVLEMMMGGMIPDATVIMLTPTEMWSGMSDENGHVTFSGPDLSGPVHVSAAKPGYMAGSIVDYDAENVSIHLMAPPPPGTPPPFNPAPPGQIQGKVLGMDKYIFVPPTDCDTLLEDETGYCQPCETNDDCVENLACVSLSQPNNTMEWRCSSPCLTDADCPEQYSCAETDENPVCFPTPPKKKAVCTVSKADMFWQQPPITSQNNVDADNYYLIPVNSTHIAVICYGGFEDAKGGFVPTVMGVRRNVYPISNEILYGQDVQLDIPLTRRFVGRLYDPPESEGGILPPEFSIHLKLDGDDGFIQMSSNLLDPSAGLLEFDFYPETLAGPLFGATYVVYTTILALADNTLASINLLQDIETLDGETFLFLADTNSQWESLQTDIEKDLSDIWMGAISVAVGIGGAIAHGGGAGWTLQNSPTYDPLYGVWGASASDIWAVGDNGTIVHFDGILWTEIENACTGILWSVWGSGPQDVYAVGEEGICQFDGTEWKMKDIAHSRHLRDIEGSGPGNIIAVGQDGKVLHFDGNTWTASFVTEGTTLRGVRVFDAEHAAIVGDEGNALFWENNGWSTLSCPTTNQLNTVGGLSPSSMWVGGNAGTLLSWDGLAWNDSTDASLGVDIQAMAFTEETSFAVGLHRLLIGPFMPFPVITEPILDGVLSDQVTWSLPEKPNVDYTSIFLLSEFGMPLWQMVVNGDESSVLLPDFSLFAVPVLPNGGVHLVLSHVLCRDESPFDIDSFIQLDFETFRRLTWSVGATTAFH